jgi:ribose 5-phosphate isomerase A
MASVEAYKKLAAEAAVQLIQSGMVLGLGHGSTFKYVLEPLAAKLRSQELRDIVGVACSLQTESDMQRLGIPMGDLNAYSSVDLTIDGADEVDPQYNLIKGGGGALLREKIVAQSSKRSIIVVDEGKLSPALGTKHSLPVEVTPFGWKRQHEFLESIGAKPTLRLDKNGKPVLSDQGNYLIDCSTGPISNLDDLASQLQARTGIMEHGLFLGLATHVIVAGPKGVQHLRAESG